MNYRNLAQEHLENADAQLAKGEDQFLKYAALELRMAMEALTYDRATAYKDEFPPREYDTWQPRKVMSILLEIDPGADKDSSIAIGEEEQAGVPASKMISLGTEKVLGLKTLKKHYDALGSYLHIPSLKSTQSRNDINYEKFRSRCLEISRAISEALSSPVFNCTFGNFTSINCFECGKPIRKRIHFGVESMAAECYECGATYTITDVDDSKSRWTPRRHEIKCANKDCTEKVVIWQHELELGRHWICQSCHGKNSFVLAIKFDAPQEEGAN